MKDRVILKAQDHEVLSVLMRANTNYDKMDQLRNVLDDLHRVTASVCDSIFDLYESQKSR